MIAQNYHYTSLETKAKRLSINLSITKATCRTVEQYETLSQIISNKHKTRRETNRRTRKRRQKSRKRRMKRWRGDGDEKSKWNKKEK